MCLVAFATNVLPGYPLALAANREEHYSRPSAPPRLFPSVPRIFCGVDLVAGGTWLAVNEHRLTVAVTNRRRQRALLPGQAQPATRPSRGNLCRRLAGCETAQGAAELAMHELRLDDYDGANFLCCDPDSAYVVHAADRLEIIAIAPGLHALANGDLDDLKDPRLQLASDMFASTVLNTPEDFLRASRQVCGFRRPREEGVSIVLDHGNRGTVSSTILLIGEGARLSTMLFAPGPPDQVPYQDLSMEFARLWPDRRQQE